MDNNSQNQNNQNNGSNGNNNGSGNGAPHRQNIMLLMVAVLVTMFVMSFFMRTSYGSTSKEITYDEFVKMVDDGKVESVSIEDDKLVITPKSDKTEKTDSDSSFGMTMASAETGNTYYTGKAEDDDTLTQRLLKADVKVSSTIPDSSGVVLSFILYYVLPILLVWVLLGVVFKKMSKGGGAGGPFSVGKSNAKVYVQKETGVTFKDVAGEDEAKESLVEVVDFLHNPGRYVSIGAKLPKGALLVGPPGTGKTLLAKAVAGEAHVPFFSLAGSDFIELYVGVGASRVRDLFKEAAKNAPCIIFIDEIDAIGRSRDSKFGGGNEEREQTLNQLLSEMDGFDSSKGVLILGATNRPEILDKALLRPGRFDRRIIVDKPDLKGRVEILKVHSKDVKMDETVDLDAVALATSGAVGSDLANMINEAAIIAVKDHREFVCQKDLMEAVEQVLVGKEKKDRILSKEERKLVSYHEVGHALISAVQKNTEPVQKITIVPRTMGALGYVMQIPEEEKYLRTKDELYDEIIVALGGRAAEEVIFNTVTTGAENDIEKSTELARNMITMYGMSKKFGLMQLENIQSRYLDGQRTMNCSDKTAAKVDKEVMALLDECYEKAKKIISAHLDTMDKLAQFLIEKETISGKEFMKIYREVENIPEPTEEEKKAATARIYARRPESAAVGEDVPVQKEPVIKDEHNDETSSDFSSSDELSSDEGKADKSETDAADKSETGAADNSDTGAADNSDTGAAGKSETDAADNSDTGAAGKSETDKADKSDTSLAAGKDSDNTDPSENGSSSGTYNENTQNIPETKTAQGRFSHVSEDFDHRDKK